MFQFLPKIKMYADHAIHHIGIMPSSKLCLSSARDVKTSYVLICLSTSPVPPNAASAAGVGVIIIYRRRMAGTLIARSRRLLACALALRRICSTPLTRTAA
jgi:hypothetical protein